MTPQPGPLRPGETPVVAVVGYCATERREYVRRTARAAGAVLLGADHVRRSPAAVVDAVHLLEDLRCTQVVPPPPGRQDEEESAPSRGALLVSQVEYASTVVLVNASVLRVQQLDRIMAVLSHLNPTARLDLHDGETQPPTSFSGNAAPVTQEQTRPGWIRLLNSDFAPPFRHLEVSGVRHEQHRPLHPQRLAEVIRRMRRGDYGTVLRCAGFCHLASRAHITAHWDQTGGAVRLTPIAYDQQLQIDDEPLAFGQDLALIGTDLRLATWEQAMDAAALTDAELLAGPRFWATFPDPFPQWAPADG